MIGEGEQLKYRIVEVSPAIDDVKALVKVTVAVSPTYTEAVVALKVKVASTGAACDGPEERKPKLKAATTVRATRLKIVFLVIFFLSIVVPKTFLGTAGREELPTS